MAAVALSVSHGRRPSPRIGGGWGRGGGGHSGAGGGPAQGQRFFQDPGGRGVPGPTHPKEPGGGGGGLRVSIQTSPLVCISSELMYKKYLPVYTDT